MVSTARELLAEAETAKVTLREIWAHGRPPEQYVRDMFGTRDLDVALPVHELNPAGLETSNREPIRRVVRRATRGATASVVAQYRQSPGPPIVLMGRRILDGHHRAMAAYLAHRPVQAVCVDELPDNE